MSAPYTETALSHAFLKALARWAERHTDIDRIAIPTGIVTAGELVRVLRAIGLLDRRAP
jgi:hypothetical protein